MPVLGRMHRRAVKSQFEKAMGGDAVDDVEKRAFAESAQKQAEVAQGAMQKQLARQATAFGEGSPIAAGAMASGAQESVKKGAEAQALSAAESNKLAAALREKRMAQAMAGTERRMATNAAQRASGFEVATRAVEAASEIPGMNFV